MSVRWIISWIQWFSIIKSLERWVNSKPGCLQMSTINNVENWFTLIRQGESQQPVVFSSTLQCLTSAWIQLAQLPVNRWRIWEATGPCQEIVQNILDWEIQTGTHLPFSHYYVCLFLSFGIHVPLSPCVVVSQSKSVFLYQVLQSLPHPVCGIMGTIALERLVSIWVKMTSLVWYTFISLWWLSLSQPIMTVSCSPLGHYQGHLKCISFKQSSTRYSHLSFGWGNYSVIVTNRSIQSPAVISDSPKRLFQHSGLSSC